MFSGVWTGREDVASSFCIDLDDGVEIIFAHYSGYDGVGSDYEMWARVLFYNKPDGKYYEIHASHCSCYGLEDQWKPQEVDIKDIYREATNTLTNVWGNEEAIRSRLLKSLEAI